MGWNLFEKILLHHSNRDHISVDDIIEVDIDCMMIHDFFAPFCISKFNQMGFNKVATPERVVFVYDHLVPASFEDDIRHHQIAESFIAEHNIRRVHRSDGVCHQLMPEQGYVRPGDIVVGTDSHTVTYGALGAFATGVGYTEMASILGVGKIWFKVAPSIQISLNGTIPRGVYAKDIILEILGRLKTDGANYRVLEFCGPVVESMSIDSRLTLTNMSVEAGAKAGIIASDDKTKQYLDGRLSSSTFPVFNSDPDAKYEEEFNIDVSAMTPMVARPYSPDNVVSVEQIDAPINQAFLGSCTNGRIEDLAEACAILKGKHINPDVRFYVVPASREIFHQAVKKGYIETLIEAGAVVCHPSCGLCAGRSGGILEEGEAVISSNNRNFYGRMGDSQVKIYLGSPATIAASCIEGKIADCRKYL